MRIIFPLGAIGVALVAALLFIFSVEIPWEHTARLAPLVTAVIALSAVIVAAIGIRVQWRMARKRAAIDFFLKTEMDAHLVETYDNFWAAIRVMKNTPSIEEFCTSLNKDVRRSYFHVRRYLNIHEVIAVGIKNGMFDDRTCFDFWSNVLVRMVDAARPMIDFLRSKPSGVETYTELDDLYRRWKAMQKVAPIGKSA
jgi:hypothetical protein